MQPNRYFGSGRVVTGEIPKIPCTCQTYALLDRNLGLIAEQALCQGDISQGMLYVTGSEVSMKDFNSGGSGEILGHSLTDHPPKLVQGCPFAASHIKGFARNFGIIGTGRQNVRLDGVVDVTEVPTRFAVAVYEGLLTLNERCKPARYNGGVGAMRVLALAENVEIAQPSHRHAVGAVKNFGIDLIAELSGRIW